MLAAATGALRARATDMPDWRAEFERWGVIADRAQAAYDDALARNQTGELSNEKFLAVLERDVLAPWHAARVGLAATTRHIPPAARGRFVEYDRYRALREQGWELMVQGLRADDPAKIERGKALHKTADELLEHIVASPKESRR